MFQMQSGLPLISVDQMRAAEAAVIAGGVGPACLMERAASEAARAIMAFFPARQATVLCGPGNNGGDGYGIARHLAAAGVDVTVAAAEPPATAAAIEMAGKWSGPTVPIDAAPAAPLVVDALFGIGLNRPLAQHHQFALDRLRGHGRVVAVDIPSGLHGDHGRCLGRPLAADLTISFAAAKFGHVLGAGPDMCGRLAIADIGVPVESACVQVAAPRRVGPSRDIHKYGRGWVLVVEGEAGHGGAAGLAAMAALRSGAGLVTIAGEDKAPPALALMRRTDDEAASLLNDSRLGSVVIGPGMIADMRGRGWLKRLTWAGKPLVLDAGALRLLPKGPIGAPAVLTPHDGEFTQMFGPIGEDRIAAVREAAQVTEAVVLLKGPSTIIAAPDGRVAINTHNAPWLATAGSGDVLAGMIGALLAQSMPLFEAACAAAWLHGDAGCRMRPGQIADDLVALLPDVLAGR